VKDPTNSTNKPSDRLRRAERLGPLELQGLRIVGSCKSCDAYQVAEIVRPAVWRLRVIHDPACLRGRRQQREQRERKAA
jgi:hypothetical protein